MTNPMTELVKSTGVGIEREGFASREIERRGETTASHLVAAARAEIEARYVMALQRPRNPDEVRIKLLAECKRSNFAKRAFYSIPRGNKPGRMTGTAKRIEGLSIRFAEACVRVSGNILTSTRLTYDDDFKRQIQITTTDLETNAVYQQDVLLEKTIERHDVKDGQVVLSSRLNSTGQRVYIIQATDEELTQKTANLVARVSRTLELKLVPADVLEECEQEIVKTIRLEVERDPAGERKAILDAFASLNVMPADLALYLGHDVGQSVPGELVELRGLYSAIRENEVTWAEALNEKVPPAAKHDADGVVTDTPKTVGGKVAAKIAAKAAKIAAKAEAKKEEPTVTKEAVEKISSEVARDLGSIMSDPPKTKADPPPMSDEEKAAAQRSESELARKLAEQDAKLEELRQQKAEAIKSHGKNQREPGED